jgi:hypothetical protein
MRRDIRARKESKPNGISALTKYRQQIKENQAYTLPAGVKIFILIAKETVTPGIFEHFCLYLAPTIKKDFFRQATDAWQNALKELVRLSTGWPHTIYSGGQI